MDINFDSILANLKTLDPKEPWTWPMLPKSIALAGVAAAVVLAGYFLVISGQQDDLESAASKQQQLMVEYKEKYEQGINLAAYKEQRVEVEKTFGELLRQLPSKGEMEALLNDVNAAGTGLGLVFELFKPASTENLHDFYAEQPISIKLTGTYHDFGAFSSAVAHLDRIVTINDLSVSAIGNTSKLTMEATANTYRYLDSKEIQAQKKASKKGAKK